MPDVFGPWQTVYSRWRLWCDKGVWNRAIQSLARHQQGTLRFIDASHLKVHQDANGGFGGKETQAIGHTRGGANSKLHAVVDGKGRLVKAMLAAGQVSDAKIGPELVAGLRGVRIVGDKGYDKPGHPSGSVPVGKSQLHPAKVWQQGAGSVPQGILPEAPSCGEFLPTNQTVPEDLYTV